MPKLVYAPKAVDDLQGIKTYVARQFGESRAKASVKEITSTARQLEAFSGEGPRLEELIEYTTDYHYLESAVYLKKGKITGMIRGTM